MLFVSSRKKDIYQNNLQQPYVMGMNIKPIVNPPQPSSSRQISITPILSTSININQNSKPPIYSSLKDAVAPSSSNNPKPMRWGEPIWFLFHTLAEKVREDKFLFVREKLLNLINIICNNLPCPICAEHAKIYLKGINFKSIQTKAQLKEFLWTFHNSVNIRKKYPLFSREELDEKYKTAITINIINNFMNVFSKKSMSIRLIADDLYRARLIGDLKIWFNTNIEYFMV